MRRIQATRRSNEWLRTLSLPWHVAVNSTVQILNEFYARATKPSKPPALSAEAGADVLNGIIQVAIVYPVAVSTVQSAVALVLRYRLSVWDALILAAAKENSVSTIHTEYLPGGVASGQTLDGVVYNNPFDATAAITQTG